jgi:hypothetical protein
VGLEFTFHLEGILNPTITKLGKFKFIITDENGNVLYYQNKSGNLNTTAKPATLYYRDLTVTYPYARVQNTFTFEFTPVNNIPSDADKGEIFIDFPSPDFILKNLGTNAGWTFPCETWLLIDSEIQSTNWNNNVKCTNYNNNRVQVTGGDRFLAAANKAIRITIHSFKGPQTTSETLPI